MVVGGGLILELNSFAGILLNKSGPVNLVWRCLLTKFDKFGTTKFNDFNVSVKFPIWPLQRLALEYKNIRGRKKIKLEF